MGKWKRRWRRAIWIIKLKIRKLNQGAKDYEFERSMLYKYMVYSFQYVDPCLENYKSKKNFILFQLGRVIVVLLIWLVIGFGFFYTIETRNTTLVNALTNRVFIMLKRILGNLWQIFNYNVGLYLFYKYPCKIQDEIKELGEITGINRKMHQKLQCCGRHMLRFSITILSLFALLRFLTTLIYLSVDRKMSLRGMMLIGIALHRLLSLPFLLYFLFLVRLQIMKVETFTERLSSRNLVTQKQDVIESYIAICTSIKKTAKEYHIYVIFLVAFLCMFVLKFTNVIAGDINLIKKYSNVTAMEVFYYVKVTVEGAIDIAIYIIVLINISRVSIAQQNVLLNLIKLRSESYDVRLDMVVFLEKHQKLDGTGYSIFGIPITGMKTLLFAAFISLSGFIARLLLTM